MHPRVQRLGLGRELIGHVERDAKAGGAVFLNGFVADENGSAEFYGRCGYAVGPENVALPPVVLNGLPTVHPAYLRGRWFFKRL